MENEEKMGKLYGSSCYMIGCMDRVSDNGVGWRQLIIPRLIEMDIIVLDPCDKPIDIGREGFDDRIRRQQLIKEENWEELTREMKLLRAIDLRLTDSASFIIFNLDITVHACGSDEEMFWANRKKSPILINCVQGKSHIPSWLFGVLPHEFFFSNWDELFEYLKGVDDGTDKRHFKRWTFFNHDRLTIDGQKAHYKEKGIIK